MRALLRALALSVALTAPLSAPLLAQETAALISDRLMITGDTRLIAEGNVEVFYKGRSLKASRISYDQASDRLQIDGPIAAERFLAWSVAGTASDEEDQGNGAARHGRDGRTGGTCALT